MRISHRSRRSRRRDCAEVSISGGFVRETHGARACSIRVASSRPQRSGFRGRASEKGREVGRRREAERRAKRKNERKRETSEANIGTSQICRSHFSPYSLWVIEFPRQCILNPRANTYDMYYIIYAGKTMRRAYANLWRIRRECRERRRG